MCSSRMEPRWIHSFCWLSWEWRKKATLYQRNLTWNNIGGLNNSSIKWYWPEKRPALCCSRPPAPHTSAGIHLTPHWGPVPPCTGSSVGKASLSGIASWRTCECCLECHLEHFPLLRKWKKKRQSVILQAYYQLCISIAKKMGSIGVPFALNEHIHK